MTIARPEIASRLFNTPLAMDAGKAATIVDALGPRIFGDEVTVIGAEPVAHVAFETGRPSAGRVGDRLGRMFDRDRSPVFDRIGSVAVIGIEGSLVHKGAYVGASSGRTSYQGLQTQIIRAAADPSIKGAVFEVDSFGGEVAGLFETATMLRQLSEMKPTIAILTDHALSAAYALASGARSIIMPAHGSIGSIGAIQLHADMSGKLEKSGVRVTVLRAGARKAEMNPYEALSEDAATAAIGELERVRSAFADLVGMGRGARFNAAQAMKTEAAAFDGADAVSMGLADAIGHANDAFDQFIREVGR